VSIFTLGASLVASTIFSEAMWQRVWASESKKTLYGGAIIGFCLSTTLIFIVGFGGWLALVGGLADDKTNPNLYFFQVRRLLFAVFLWLQMVVLANGCVFAAGGPGRDWMHLFFQLSPSS
jgi:hypothetical protein